MSFLLDALDKADTDRNRSQINELKTPVQKKRSLLRRVLLGQLFFALLLASFALGYFARPYLERETPEVNMTRAANPQSELNAEPKAGVSSQGKIATAVEKKNIPAAQPLAAAKPLQTLNVKLSAISYSDVPASRFAMINGFVMYEGDVLSSGEKLTQIQRDSVVMQKAGAQIRVALNPGGQQ